MATKKSAPVEVPAEPVEAVEVPAEPVEAVEVLDEPIEVEHPSEPTEAVQDAPKAAETPCCVRAQAGDNYLTLAERHGLDAKALLELNNGKPILTGTKVRLR